MAKKKTEWVKSKDGLMYPKEHLVKAPEPTIKVRKVRNQNSFGKTPTKQTGPWAKFTLPKKK